jgi:hypothetical protein
VLDDGLGDQGRTEGFGGGQEPGPEQRPGGPQDQRGGSAMGCGKEKSSVNAVRNAITPIITRPCACA